MWMFKIISAMFEKIVAYDKKFSFKKKFILYESYLKFHSENETMGLLLLF